MNCYNCRFEFTSPKAATNAGTGFPAPSPNISGALYFCGACGHVNVSDSGGLRPITEDEWNSLDQDTRDDLKHGMQVCRAAQKKQSVKIEIPTDAFLKKLYTPPI